MHKDWICFHPHIEIDFDSFPGVEAIVDEHANMLAIRRGVPMPLLLSDVTRKIATLTVNKDVMEYWREKEVPALSEPPVPAAPPKFENASILQRASQAVKAIAQNVVSDVTGIDINQRPELDIIRITAICNACPERGKFNFCTGCGCNLTQKIRNASTRCPMIPPKWVEYDPDTAKKLTSKDGKVVEGDNINAL